jgi:hypothetical protein
LSCFIESAEGVHGALPYYAVKITAGGDKQKCEDLVAIVHSYINGVLKVPEQFNSSGHKPTKPH